MPKNEYSKKLLDKANAKSGATVACFKLFKRGKFVRYMLSILQYVTKQKQNKMVKTQLVKTCEFVLADLIFQMELLRSFVYE